MITTFDLNENNTVFSENILPKFCNFDNDGSFDFVVTGGTGTVELQPNAPTENVNLVNQGSGSLKITSLAYNTTDLVFKSSASKDAFNQEAPINDLVSLCLLKEGNQNVKVELEIYYLAALYGTVKFDLSNYPNYKWIRLGQTVAMNSGEYTFKWILKADTSDASTVCVIYIDSFCIQRINNYINNVNIPYLPAKGISIEKTETIDIANVPTTGVVTTTVAITGAKVGDEVRCIPNLTFLNSGLAIIKAWASADDEVKFTTFNPTNADINPASGVFKFKIVR